MKTHPLYLLCVLLFLLLGCDPETDEVMPGDAQTPGVEFPKEEIEDGPAAWAKGFPKVYSGTHTLKAVVSMTKPGMVYYVISDKKLEGITAHEIKEFATAQSATNRDDDIILSGIVDFGPAKINDTASFRVEVPSSSRNYFTYLVAEIKENDSIYFFLDGGKIKENVNYISPRETQEQYASEKRGKQIHYLFYALEDYYLNPELQYPLLVFLHGKGEYGDGTKLNLYKNGIIPQLIHEGMDLPFVVVSPQIDTGRWDTDFVDEFIDHIISNYRVDENRIYMTGNSLGGIGTWEYAGDFPNRLAAMLPISGEGDTLEACYFKEVPVWAFHNAEDGIVDVQGSVDLIEALQACAPPAYGAPQLTIYLDKGHNAWIRTYNLSAGHDIYNWMLGYSKADR